MKKILVLAIVLLSQVSWALTLAEKERVFNDRANVSKQRFGLIGNSADKPIWTGIYVASQAYRYEATQDPEALQQLEESMWGLVKLHDITGIPGIFSRVIEPISRDKEGKLPNGFFAGKGEFKDFMWRSSLSFDQYVGYIYGLTEGFPIVQDPHLKNDIGRVMRSIAEHFLSHDEKIEGPDTDLNYNFSPGRAMYALQLLKSSYAVTGDKKYHSYYMRLIRDRSYATIVRDQTQGNVEADVKKFNMFINIFAKVYAGTAVKSTPDSLRSSVAQNLGHMALSHLATLESDPEIKDCYLKGLISAHKPVARHSNTYWNFLLIAAGGNDPVGIKEGVNSLNRFPMDNYGVRTNSTDPKIKKYKGLDANFFKGAKWQWFAESPLPFERRPMHSFAWQHNAMLLDGKFSHTDAPGVAYLIAYWMGRNLNLISPAQ